MNGQVPARSWSKEPLTAGWNEAAIYDVVREVRLAGDFAKACDALRAALRAESVAAPPSDEVLVSAWRDARSALSDETSSWDDDLSRARAFFAALRHAPPALDAAPLIVGRLALGQPTGACWRASLATITGLDVPSFDGAEWFTASQAFLAEHGWSLEPSPAKRPVPGFSVAVGDDHAAVALDGAVIWDPGTGRRDGGAFLPYSFCPVRRAATPASGEPAAAEESRPPQWRMCPDCGHAEGLHYGPCSFITRFSPTTICGCERRAAWMDPAPPAAGAEEPPR